MLTTFSDKYTEYHVRQIRKLPLLVKLLIYVGFAGIATHRQLARYLNIECGTGNNGFTQETVIEIIKEAIKRELLLEVRPNFDAGGRFILYLSSTGKNLVLDHLPWLAEHLTAGTPNDYRTRNIRHDLIIAESLIFWRRLYEIVLVHSESFLRSVDKRREWENKKAIINVRTNIEVSNSLPDYEILLFNSDSGFFSNFRCEAAVSYKTSKIESKGPLLRWFVEKDSVKNKVEATRSETADIVTPLDDFPDYNLDSAVQEELLSRSTISGIHSTKTERDLYRILNETELTMGLRELALFTGAGKKTLIRSATELINAKQVRFKNLTVREESATFDETYIYLPKNRAHVAKERIERHIIMNEVFRTSHKQGYRFVAFDPAIALLTLTKRNAKRYFLCDQMDAQDPNSISKSCELVRALPRKIQKSLWLVVSNRNREIELEKELCPIAIFRSFTSVSF